MKFGYCRVSTKSQDLSDQIEKLHNQGIDDRHIYSEKYTGKTVNRPRFDDLNKILRIDDELVVTKLDRLARNTKEALEVIDDLNNRGVKINVLNMGVIDDSPMGRLAMTMLLAFAEFERNQIIERTQSGKEYAKAHKKNYHEGRPKVGIDARRKSAYDLLQNNTYSKTAEMTGFSVSTLKRIKKQIEQ